MGIICGRVAPDQWHQHRIVTSSLPCKPIQKPMLWFFLFEKGCHFCVCLMHEGIDNMKSEAGCSVFNKWNVKKNKNKMASNKLQGKDEVLRLSQITWQHGGWTVSTLSTMQQKTTALLTVFLFFSLHLSVCVNVLTCARVRECVCVCPCPYTHSRCSFI